MFLLFHFVALFLEMDSSVSPTEKIPVIISEHRSSDFIQQMADLHEVSQKMAMVGVSRVIVCLLICVQFSEARFIVPDVDIKPLWPKGITVSIPEVPNVTLFVFQGNINRVIGENDSGSISAEVFEAKNGKFSHTDFELSLKVGDIINYYVYIMLGQEGYLKDNLSFTVVDFKGTSTTTNSSKDCIPTLSLIRGVEACRGDILFEDNFDNFREDLWQIEQYIPEEPDFPFVSYQQPAVTVEGGYLKIEPKFLQDLPGYSESSIYSGTLDLSNGCTGISRKCRTEAWGASILPPIVTGKLTTKAFAFTYGVVEIRAKLPQGDWLYPDILLESLFKKYGSVNYASGVLRIAGALGNVQLSAGSNELGNKVLYGGPIIDFKCREKLLIQRTAEKPWGDDFHNYSLRWEPEKITLFVDGEEWARVEPAASGLIGRLRAMAGPGSACDTTRFAGAKDSIMAPFDDHFFISLGLMAGGITEFRDSLTSEGIPKPWQNSGRKASLRFWQDSASWFPTWKQPAMLVDYVRVKAL